MARLRRESTSFLLTPPPLLIHSDVVLPRDAKWQSGKTLGSPDRRAIERHMEWISASDRLPEKRGMYIVYSKGHIVPIVACAYFDGLCFHEPPWDVTHWIPLPEPPK